jgi:GT2 family glycosyltransferase
LASPLDIVLLQCGLSDLTVRCLRSIPRDYRIILVDNGSPQEDVEKARAELLPDDTMILLPENYGFAKAMNIGIMDTTAPFVCILNNDTVIADDAFDRMIHYMEIDRHLGLIGPKTNRCESEQRAEGPGPPGWCYTNGLIAFFCTIIRREALDDVGMLSEEYGLGYGEDDDYCIRMRQAGWKLGIANDAWVDHDHHATYLVTIGQEGMDREGQQGHDMLRQKYGSAV